MRPRRPLRFSVALLVALAAPVGLAGPAGAQHAASTVEPDTVRVGDVFQVRFEFELPAGHQVALPDSLMHGEELERAGSIRLYEESLDDGGTRVTAVYPLSAWRPGEVALPRVSFEATGPEGSYKLEARPPRFVVRSVLPADAEEPLEARPPKDVIGPNRVLWPWLLAGLAALVTLAVLIVLWRNRQITERVLAPVPPPSPREAALAALDEVRTIGLLEAGEFKAFYSRTTDAIRGYLDATRDGWGAELTSSELLERMRGAVPAAAFDVLARLLDRADRVKFAKHRPTVDDAREDWARARDWILADTPVAEEATEPVTEPVTVAVEAAS